MATRDEWARHFADSLRRVRMGQGLSVPAMAEQWGVDERTYRKYERGQVSPQLIDFCYALDRMDAPILRPILNFLHPDIFAEGDADLNSMRQQLVYYIENVASDRMLRQVYYTLLGQAADNVAPQLEMVSAIQHLPLLDRVITVKFILSLYELAEHRGELVHMDQLPPDIAALKMSADQAEEACKRMKDGYSTLTTD